MGNNFTYITSPSPPIATQTFSMTITDEFNLVNAPTYTYFLKLGVEPTIYFYSSYTTNTVTFTNLTYASSGTNIEFILYEDSTGSNVYSPVSSNPLYSNYVSYTSLFNVNPICYVKGTKILCLIDNIELYVKIEDIKYDTLIKTYLHGYKKIKKLVYSTFENSLEYNNNIISNIYKLSKDKEDVLIEDLYVSGQHSLLVDSLTEKQIKKLMMFWSQLLKIDDKFLLMSCADERFEIILDKNIYELYQVVLEHENINGRYGIYANGILSESMSLNTFNRKKKGIDLYKVI